LFGIEQAKEFVIGSNSVLIRGKICVPYDVGLKMMILEERDKSRFSMHSLSMTKMYQNLKESLWWSSMKCDVTQFVATCVTDQKAKVKYHTLGRILQSLEIP